MSKRQTSFGRQKGVVAALFAVALFSIVALAGMAADSAHAYLDKTRLQNALDSSALAAARTLGSTTSVAQAAATARAVFDANLNGSGFSEIKGKLTDAASSLVVEFSTTVNPFAAGAVGVNAKYVRVRLNKTVDLATWFMGVTGVNTLSVSSSSVSGPSPSLATACDIAPIFACSDPAGTAANNWGYNIGQYYTLAPGAGNNAAIGPGNYNLLQLSGPGGDAVRNDLAGAYGGCASLTNTVTTKTGVNTGPVEQGINTRFNVYSGNLSPTQYPPDVYVTSAQSFTYAQYQNLYATDASGKTPGGVAGRRVLAVPIGNCAGAVNNGVSQLPVSGLGCFFLREQAGERSKPQGSISGEFIGKCNVQGNAGNDPNKTGGATVIQLYGDTSRWDS